MRSLGSTEPASISPANPVNREFLVLGNSRLGCVYLAHPPQQSPCRKVCYFPPWFPWVLFVPFAHKPLSVAEQWLSELLVAFSVSPNVSKCLIHEHHQKSRRLYPNNLYSPFGDEMFSAWIPQPGKWERISWALQTEPIGHTSLRLELQFQLKKWLGKEGDRWIVTYEVLKQKSIEWAHDKHFKECCSQFLVHLTNILTDLFWAWRTATEWSLRFWDTSQHL